MELTAGQIAEVLGGVVEGDCGAKVTSFARIENGKPGSISFYANPKYEKYVYSSRASVLIVNKTFVPKENVAATMVRVDDAYSAVAALLDYVTAERKKYSRHRGRHCRIAFSSKLGKKVYVGDCTYIGKRAKVGDMTKIYEQVYVGEDVEIGSRCIIYPGVKIYPGMKIGDNVIIHSNAVIGADGFGFAPLEDGTYRKIQHTGNVIIGNDVEIGANTCIDKSQIGSTIIHDGVKIDNLCQIAHNVEVGKNTVMSAMVGIAGSTKVGEHCILAGQVGIANGLHIASNTTVGAQAGVMSNIKNEGEVLFGTPAIKHREFLRSYAVFRRNGRENK
ncbi:MAG: UDP-3-O-(3-hydroxymyristoyl)glucosamine N-acyltransferase [Candidatus Cryptobacteroides sp.]